MLKIILPIIAFIAVLEGLIAAEPPLTQEQLDQKFAQEKMEQLKHEYEDTIDELNKLDREKKQAQIVLIKLSEIQDNYPALEDSIDRTRENSERQKAEAEGKITDAEAKMAKLEQRSEEWVRIAYNLAPDALPPGYLARVLWTADKTAITESAKLAKDLRATLHITESTANKLVVKLRAILSSRYTRRTLISAAAALASLAVLESAEPVFEWTFDRWWKLLVAMMFGVLTFIAVVQLQKRKIME